MFFDPRRDHQPRPRSSGSRTSFVAVVVQTFVDMPRFGAGRDFTYLRKDGQQRTHATSIVKRVDGHGETSGFVITSDDVTDRVRAQESLVEALDVERRAVDRLRQIDQIKDDLISTVSHELRTPITSIVGYVGALRGRRVRRGQRRSSSAPWRGSAPTAAGCSP